MSSQECRVEIQYRDFHPDAIRELVLEEGERVISVESGTRGDPTFRVWIEVPAELAEQRRLAPLDNAG